MFKKGDKVEIKSDAIKRSIFGFEDIEYGEIIENGESDIYLVSIIGRGLYYCEGNRLTLKYDGNLRSIPDDESKEFGIEMYFHLLSWEIDELLDKYNETGNKEYLQKCEELMEG